jgi:hypothetical protein
MLITLYCLEEWWDNFTPRGQNSQLEDNFAPRGEVKNWPQHFHPNVYMYIIVDDSKEPKEMSMVCNCK